MTEWEKITFDENPDIRIGISSCLLGENVRFNGGHAHDSFTTTTLGPYVEWHPICPEVDIGMGTPRENIRLVRDGKDTIRLVGPKSGTDYTEPMRVYAREQTNSLTDEGLHGYILKKNSPSCGMERVKVYDQNDVPQRTGRGLFASALIDRFPHLPVEEEGRLRDTHIRENFIERIFAYYRLQKFLESDPSTGNLVEFHTRHKLTMLSHNQAHYREMGRLVAGAGDQDPENVLEEYASKYMHTLKIHATRKNHTNVLHHILGYFKDDIDRGDKEELVSVIDNYREGLVPLVVPLTLIKHHLRRHPVGWLENQVYLTPYPKEFMLRNII